MPPIDESLPERAYYKLLKHLGEKETLPNRGPVVNWAIRPWTKKQTGEWASWCAGAVCTAYLEAGSEQIKKIGSLSVQSLFDQLNQRGEAYIYSKQYFNHRILCKGDLIFFGTGNHLHHVGLINSASEDCIWTLEGNHNNQVSQVLRYEYFGFGKIRY